MKKIVSTLLLTFFLLVSVIGSVFNIRLVSSEPRIWIVDDDGPADFHSIQEAINAAGDGDIINVRSGTYYENLVLNKSVALIGENKSATIIDGGGKLYESVLCIRANETMVANFTIQNSGYMAYGIFLEGVQNTTIIHNRIINNQFGIVLFSSYKNIIVENYINGSYFDAVGVWGGSAYNIIANNLISKATHGIYLGSCNYNNIIKNEINKCSLGIYANYIHDATIEGNIIENNGCGMYLVGAGYCPVPKKLINPNYVVNNTIKNNSRGVGFYYATMTYMFYHNNFINNSKQVDTGETPDFSINVWDHGYPSGGNYWSDYAGVDLYSGPYQNETGSDGIGDVPYIIDENNVDRYPLMEPWAPKYELAINSTPVVGVPFSINGTLCYTPFVEMLPEGSYLVEMPEIYDEFVWCCWLDDGDTDRTKLVRLPPDCTLTAVYTPISWEYIFEDDLGRNTTLKVSVDDHYFRFIASNKTFPVKYDSDMTITDHLIFIDYEDDELILQATAIVTQRWSLCIALAVDVKTGTKYVLLDLPEWFSWRLRIW